MGAGIVREHPRFSRVRVLIVFLSVGHLDVARGVGRLRCDSTGTPDVKEGREAHEKEVSEF